MALANQENLEGADPHEEIVRLEDIVVWDSNSSTAKEATKELAAAETKRGVLIEQINPRVVS
jgi:hypothetical protein